MNRKQRRLKQQELNRQIRQRERYLSRKAKEYEKRAQSGYLSEEQAFDLLAKIYNGSEKK